MEPQASTLLRVEKADACGSGSGGEVCAGWERLKALFAEYVLDTDGCFCAGCSRAAGLGGGAGGELRSKRESMLLGFVFVFGGGDLVVLEVDVIGEAAEEKSPQSPPKLSLRGAGVGWVGGEVGFAGAAGFMSKKEPPLSDGCFVVEGCLVCPEGEVRLAKGEGLAAGCWVKERELNASFIPPKDCDCEVD